MRKITANEILNALSSGEHLSIGELKERFKPEEVKLIATLQILIKKEFIDSAKGKYFITEKGQLGK